MPAVGELVEWVVATLARSASTLGAGGDTDLEIACLTASPVRSGLVPLICLENQGSRGYQLSSGGTGEPCSPEKMFAYFARELRT